MYYSLLLFDDQTCKKYSTCLFKQIRIRIFEIPDQSFKKTSGSTLQENWIRSGSATLFLWIILSLRGSDRIEANFEKQTLHFSLSITPAGGSTKYLDFSFIYLYLFCSGIPYHINQAGGGKFGHSTQKLDKSTYCVLIIITLLY